MKCEKQEEHDESEDKPNKTVWEELVWTVCGKGRKLSHGEGNHLGQMVELPWLWWW